MTRRAWSMRLDCLPLRVAVALACCALGVQGCRGSSAQKNIEPVYDPDTGRLRQLRYDSDGNGKVDTVSHMDGARVLRIEIDKDEDGKVERWEYYDAARKLERVGLSRANDGVEDAWSYMGPDGKVSRVAISTRRDGSISRTEFYQADLPTSAEEDTDGDGAIDKWESYEAGRLASVAFDSMQPRQARPAAHVFPGRLRQGRGGSPRHGPMVAGEKMKRRSVSKRAQRSQALDPRWERSNSDRFESLEVAMRRFIAVVLASLLVFASTPQTSAAAKSTGTITGVAKSTAGQPLGGHSVRVRSVRTGDVVATATTSANGSFVVPNLDPGSYVVEIVDTAGRIVGTSAIATVVEGSIASLTVTAASTELVGGASHRPCRYYSSPPAPWQPPPSSWPPLETSASPSQ